MELVVTEKPSVAESIAAVIGAAERRAGHYSGNGYLVTWCAGHLVRPAGPEAYGAEYEKWTFESLPVLPETWRHEIRDSARERFFAVKKLMNGETVTEIVNACDAGREGELIFRLVYEAAGCTKPVKRLWISSMEDSAIREGFSDLKPQGAYDDLYRSALCRQRADWLVGINATRLFTVLCGGRLLKAGRVQSPVLAELAARESEIARFARKPFYTVTLTAGGMAAVSERTEEKPEAEGLAAACAGETARVVNVTSEERAVPPPKLYDLTALQRAANRLYGFTAKETLSFAQGLYEKKLLTYPRTDGRYLTDDMEGTVRSVLAAVRGKFAFSGPEPGKADVSRVLDGKRVGDHHALIPTAELAGAELSALTDGERKILSLISARLVAATGEPHEYRETKIVLSCDGRPFTVSGKAVISAGWKAAEGGTDGERTEEETKDPLWELREGAELPVTRAETRESFTSPPEAYTDASLLSFMERAGAGKPKDGAKRKGIGSPATRADVIEKLVADGFVRREGKRLIPTEDGAALASVLPAELKSPKLTADWENALSLVAEGKKTAESFMAEIAGMVTELVRTNREAGEAVKKAFKKEKETFGACPRCGGRMIKGKYGVFCEERCGMSIAKYYSVPFTDGQIKDLLAGKEIILRGLAGKSGKPYDLCLKAAGTEEYSCRKDGREIRGYGFAYEKSYPEKSRGKGRKEKA